MNLLKLFYHERHVPYDCQLTLQGSSFGLNRLESRGAFFLDSATPEVQAQKLRNYRQEMQDVAAFIKERYFDEDEVINNGYDG